MAALELSDDRWGRDDPEPSADDSFAAVPREIAPELSPDDELSGQILRVEARFKPSDDVVVSLIDGAFALGHRRRRLDLPGRPAGKGAHGLFLLAGVQEGQEVDPGANARPH